MKLIGDRRIQRPTWREILLLLPIAFCYAFFIVLGDWQRSAPYSNARNMGRLVLWIAISWAILLLLGFLLENGSVLTAVWAENAILPAGVRKVLTGLFSKGHRRQGHWRIWLLFSLLCLFCYLPYYLMYYPTWFNNDAVWQMQQAFGMAAKSNHHPYFHTLIIKVFLAAGNFLFGNLTAAVAFYTFFQMAMVSAVFGFLLFLLYKKGTGVFWLLLAAGFYALLPVNAMFSICMGKDAWFTAAFLLFTWAVSACVREKDAAQAENAEDPGSAENAVFRGWWVFYILTGLSVCLLRSNGIFVFLGTSAFLILSSLGRKRMAWRRRQPLFVSTAVVLTLYLFWQGPILSALHVEPPDTIEGLTMPTQHLLCAYKRGGSLTTEEIEMLERVVPLAEIDEYYNPYLFDMTKNYIRQNGHQEVIAENRGAYAKLWLSVGLKNPMLYLEGQIRQTAGYYALRIPHETYLYGDYFMVENPFGIEAERKLFSYDDSLVMGKFLQGFQTLYGRIWSLGANTWLLLLGLACALYRRRGIAPYLPALCLLISLLLAAPVYNEFRYAYGVFAALPLLLSISFGRGEAAG